MSLPEHTGYKSHLKRMSNVAMQVGKALGPRKRPSKAVDTSQFSGVASGVRDYRPERYIPGERISTKIKDIGGVSVQPGGKTFYEAVHPGVDIANITGTRIPSFTGGTVSKIVSGKKWKDPGFGNYIIVTDQQGNKHRYSHLSASYVKVGDPIYRGMPIGEMGRSGQTYSASGKGDPSHLDYRIRSLYGKYLSPYDFI